VYSRRGHFKTQCNVISCSRLLWRWTKNGVAVSILLFLAHFMRNSALNCEPSNRLMFVGLRQRDPQTLLAFAFDCRRNTHLVCKLKRPLPLACRVLAEHNSSAKRRRRGNHKRARGQ
jgi:hypothetical protein